LEVESSFDIGDDLAAAHFFRIAREAVINANKHSKAREIVIKLERVEKEIVLRVTDDGVGVSNEHQLRPGLGLHIMNYRAQLMGARLEIDSPKRGGTCVSCYLPDRAADSRTSQSEENGQSGRLPAKSAMAPAAADLNLRHLTSHRAANP
jgi:nitrate/nitrite-specific signal transduction histidine kinase